ncbi:hypothetical protein HPB50_028619 [Hyalomma asiaticum]|nr:hypothetical protein HPB50_028619 [Hyalomma asiaticum]
MRSLREVRSRVRTLCLPWLLSLSLIALNFDAVTDMDFDEPNLIQVREATNGGLWRFLASARSQWASVSTSMRHLCGTFCLPTYLVINDSLLGNTDPELRLRYMVEKVPWNERRSPPWLLFQRSISGQGTIFQHGFVQTQGTGRGVGHPAAITSREGERQLICSIEQGLMIKTMVALRQLYKEYLHSSGHATPQTFVDYACELEAATCLLFGNQDEKHTSGEVMHPGTCSSLWFRWIQLPTTSSSARHTLMPAADIEAQLCRAGQESVWSSTLERLHFEATRQATSADVADTTMVMTRKATQRRQEGPRAIRNLAKLATLSIGSWLRLTRDNNSMLSRQVWLPPVLWSCGGGGCLPVIVAVVAAVHVESCIAGGQAVAIRLQA